MFNTVKVPFSVSSKTRKGLTDKMTELKLRSEFDLQFFDIQWSPSEKKWVAWYVDQKQILLRRKKDGTS